MKNPWATTYQAIKLAYQDRFVGGELLGDLANDGVGLGTIAASVPTELLNEVEQVKAAIIAGDIIVIP
jgi:basic membrane lipoprotein Med (substrate-binding protein (PBP1-ABC) superfamily)